jgi:hypothetical protein
LPSHFRLAMQARQKIVQYVTKGNISHSEPINKFDIPEQ